jgi:hypothetical protein
MSSLAVEDGRARASTPRVSPHAGHQPLARAHLSLQQQGRDVRVPEGVEGGEVAELYLQGLDRRGVSEEPGGGIGR